MKKYFLIYFLLLSFYSGIAMNKPGLTFPYEKATIFFDFEGNWENGNDRNPYEFRYGVFSNLTNDQVYTIFPGVSPGFGPFDINIVTFPNLVVSGAGAGIKAEEDFQFLQRYWKGHFIKRGEGKTGSLQISIKNSSKEFYFLKIKSSI